MSVAENFTVLHFVAAAADRGGILTVVRELSGAQLGRAIVWVNHDFRPSRKPGIKWLRHGEMESERISLGTIFQAAGVAWRLRGALAKGRRIFHGHSRAGLLVGLWLNLFGCDRVVVSVHCYGRQRWFYRWAATWLGERLVWLTPAMKRYYGVGAGSWRGCVPNFISAPGPLTRVPGERDRLRLGGIGALVRWKGWHLVLAALRGLPAGERERVDFTHIGSPDGTLASASYAEELQGPSVEGTKAGQIAWRGEVESSAGLLGEIDVLVLPSGREPFGMAVLEAWAAGVPVLTSDGCGAVELLAGRRGGWSFAAGSVEELRGKISGLLRSREDLALRPERLPAAPIVARWRELYTGLLA